MKKISIIYWSGTGNTQKMAQEIARGAENENIEVTLKSLEAASVNDVKNADVVALGCPSMGNEVLEEGQMEPFIENIAGLVSGKPVLLFGSYGWGDGQWMREWVERMDSYGANLISEGLIINYTPDEDGIRLCNELGKTLAKA